MPTTPATPNDTSPAAGWRRPLLWTAIFTALGLLTFFHFYLDDLARDHPGRLYPRLIEELTGAWSGGLLALLLIPWLRRIRALAAWPARYGAHLGALLAYSLLHTSLIWASRSALFPLLGLGAYDYGEMPWRYPMEFSSDVVVYVLAAGGTWLFDYYRANRERELHAAQLESALAEARLEALRLQLNPHFLFNALNAVSAIMYEQPRAADEMLSRIGELLRATLRADTQEHALAEEWRLLELYLDIQRARFGAQLRLELELAPDLEAARVPFLLLQPLLENAIEHAGDPALRSVAVHAAARDGRLEFVIRNAADGNASTHRGHGIGLGNLRSRLAQLYGDAAGVVVDTAGQGTEARLWLPLRRDAAA